MKDRIVPKARIKGAKQIKESSKNTRKKPAISLYLVNIQRKKTKGITTKYQRNPFKKSNKISFISSHITKPPHFYV